MIYNPLRMNVYHVRQSGEGSGRIFGPGIYNIYILSLFLSFFLSLSNRLLATTNTSPVAKWTELLE